MKFWQNRSKRKMILGACTHAHFVRGVKDCKEWEMNEQDQ